MSYPEAALPPSADMPRLQSTGQPKVLGYRELTPEEVALVNEIKAHAEATRDLSNRVFRFIEKRADETQLGPGEAPHSTVTHPARWHSLAQTSLQVGYMELVRSVTAPSTF